MIDAVVRREERRNIITEYLKLDIFTKYRQCIISGYRSGIVIWVLQG